MRTSSQPLRLSVVAAVVLPLLFWGSLSSAQTTYRKAVRQHNPSEFYEARLRTSGHSAHLDSLDEPVLSKDSTFVLYRIDSIIEKRRTAERSRELDTTLLRLRYLHDEDTASILASYRSKNNSIVFDTVFSTDLFRDLLLIGSSTNDPFITLGDEHTENRSQNWMKRTSAKDSARSIYDLTYKIATVNSSLRISNSIVDLNYQREKEDPHSIDTIVFKRSVRLLGNRYLCFGLENAIFRDTAVLSFDDDLRPFTRTPAFASDTDPCSAYLRGCRFDNRLVVIGTHGAMTERENPSWFNPLSRNSWFGAQSTLTRISFERSIFTHTPVFRCDTLRYVNFRKCSFAEDLVLKNKFLDSCRFDNTVFKRMLDMRSAHIKNGSTFDNAFFEDGCNIMITKDDDITKMALTSSAIAKTFFIIDWGWQDGWRKYLAWDELRNRLVARCYSERTGTYDEALDSAIDRISADDLQNIRSAFGRIEQYVTEDLADDDYFGATKKDIANRLYFEFEQYDKQYQLQNGNYLKYLWLCFIQNSVNFGYKGEFSFFEHCLVIILIFTFIYRTFYWKQIDTFIAEGVMQKYETTASEFWSRQPFRSLSRIGGYIGLELLKCFYFSIIIFFDPRLPSKILQLDKGLARVAATQWSIGAVYVVLFILYIGGSYPIFPKLIGL